MRAWTRPVLPASFARMSREPSGAVGLYSSSGMYSPSDRLGGARVALFSVLIEAAGLALVWLANEPIIAVLGAALTGLGYSLVYPGLGVEAVRRAPPHGRGLVMGIYTAFLDVALGFGSPVLGLVACWAGLPSVYLASAAVVLCTMPVTARLLQSPGRASA